MYSKAIRASKTNGHLPTDGTEFVALATDGDGTLLRDGHMGRREIDALQRWRRAGKKVLLITGETPDQLCDFPHLELYDRVVAENGALLLNCGTRREKKLAKPPPTKLVQALNKANIKSLNRGRVIFQADLQDEDKIKRVLRKTGTGWRLIHNRDELMIVPPGVTKATGLAAILKQMKIRPEQVVAVGDAENDRPLLDNCGLQVAVHNAVPQLKKKSRLVLKESYGNGIAELIDRLLGDKTKHPKKKRNKRHSATTGGKKS